MKKILENAYRCGHVYDNKNIAQENRKIKIDQYSNNIEKYKTKYEAERQKNIQGFILSELGFPKYPDPYFILLYVNL